MQKITAEAAMDMGPALSCTQAIETQKADKGSGTTGRSLWNVMAFAGLAVGLLLGFGMARQSDSSLEFGSQNARQSLLQCGTPESCVTEVGLVTEASAIAPGNETLLASACCTRCHNGTDGGAASGLAITGGDQFASLSDSCRVCHMQ